MRVTKLVLLLGPFLAVGCAGSKDGNDDVVDTDDPATDTDPVTEDTDDSDPEDTGAETDEPPLDTEVLESFLPGEWDEGFVMPGFTGESAARVLDTVRLPDGRLAAAGIFHFVTDVAAAGVAVREEDGSWAPLAGGIEAAIEDLFVASDGTVYAAGWTGGFIGVNGGVWRLDDGAWTQIANFWGGRVYALHELPDGRLLVGGDFFTTDVGDALGLAVWDETEENFVGFDPDFGSSGWAIVRSFFAWPDQDFCVAGLFDEIGGAEVGGVACYRDGDGWTALGSVPGEVYGVATLGNGRVMAWGGFATGTPPDDLVIGLAEYVDGDWVAPEELGVDGGLVTTVRALLPDGDDGYYIAGQFSTAGVFGGSSKPGPSTINIAYFDGTAFQPLGAGLVPTTGVFAPNVEGGYHLRREDDGSVVIGGMFHQADGITGSGLAVWDGAAMSVPYAQPKYLALEGGGTAVGVAPGGSVWLAAEIAETGYVASLLKWNGTAFTVLHDGPSGYVSDILTVPGTLYVSGLLEGFGVDLCDVASYDGRRWKCLVRGLGEEGTPKHVKALATDGKGNLALVGNFTVGGGVNVAWFDGTNVVPLGDGIEGTVNDVAVDPATGDVYVAGFGFDGFEGVAWWDASEQAWKPLDTGLDGSVNDLAWWNGKLIVGGGPMKRPVPDAAPEELGPLVAWDGTEWSVFADVSGFYPMIFMVKAVGDGLFVWGDVPNVGDATDSSLYYTEDGTTWQTLGVGTDDIVMDIAIGTDAVWVTGYFQKAGGTPSFGVARWVPVAP